jgi:hypothetical protein
MDEDLRKMLDNLPPGLQERFPEIAAMRDAEVRKKLRMLGVDPDHCLELSRGPNTESKAKTQGAICPISPVPEGHKVKLQFQAQQIPESAHTERYTDIEKGVLVVLLESGPSLKLEGIEARLEPPAQTAPARAKVEDALVSLRTKKTVDFGGRSPIDWQGIVPTLLDRKDTNSLSGLKPSVRLTLTLIYRVR